MFNDNISDFLTHNHELVSIVGRVDCNIIFSDESIQADWQIYQKKVEPINNCRRKGRDAKKFNRFNKSPGCLGRDNYIFYRFACGEQKSQIVNKIPLNNIFNDYGWFS